MEKRKRNYWHIVMLIIISLVCQNLSVTVKANQKADTETVYIDGIEFAVAETEDGIEIDGEIEGGKDFCHLFG